MNATDVLTFSRQDSDTAFDEQMPCNEPDCPACVWRNSMRRLLGTLVEAVQLEAKVQEASVGLWSECADPTCDFEMRLLDHVEDAVERTTAAFAALKHAVAMWETLPADWMQRERDAMIVAVDVSQKITEDTL